MDQISADEISREHILIDVRTPAEYRSEKIPGSTNLPLAELKEQGLSLQHQENLVIVCASGNRAKTACALLDDLGIEAQLLEGGIKAYKAANYEIEMGTGGAISLERQVRILAGALAATGGILAATVDPNWGFLSAFIGCGLVFAGVTDTCGMAVVLSKLPYNNR